MAIGEGGDEQWYEELCRKHWDRLLEQASRLLWPRCRQDAEDVVQAVFMTVWRRRRDRPADAEPGAWLHGILYNHVRQVWGRPGRTVVVPADQPGIFPGGEDAGFSMVEQECDLRAAWAQLGPEERLVLSLRFDQGMDYQQIAEVLDVSQGAARKRVQRARDHLQMITDGNDGPGSPGRQRKGQ